MGIGSVKTLGSIDPRQVYGTGMTPPAKPSFAQQLSSAIAEVDRMQTSRDEMVTDLVSGRIGEVHDVMTAAEEAQLAFELLLEVRNKLLESYQEIMRMHV
jgi:flagellar hook-basal body complex protein FliE